YPDHNRTTPICVAEVVRLRPAPELSRVLLRTLAERPGHGNTIPILSAARVLPGKELVMVRRMGILCLLLLVPSQSFGEQAALAPEQLLSAETILYIRYDGVEPHRRAFEQTATGELMRGEL